MAGVLWDEGCWAPVEAPSCTDELAVECNSMAVEIWGSYWPSAAALRADVGNAVPAAVCGEWVWRQWQEDYDGTVTGGPVFANFTFAEDCTPAEKFVPEPGTVILLGSGLAGLAPRFCVGGNHPPRGPEPSGGSVGFFVR